MLAYAHINLLSMLSRFEPDEAILVATNSIYVKKKALCKLKGVGAYKPQEVHPEENCRNCLTCHDKATLRPPRDGIAPAQWRDKGDSLYILMEHAAYLTKPDYICSEKDLTPSTAPGHDDPLTRHQLSYLNGGRQRQNHASDRAPRLHPNPSPGQRDAVQAQTYHSFFRWSGQTDWTPERMGQKLVPCVIICDELHSAPPHSGNLPRQARGTGRPGHLLWRPGAAASNHRRNAT